MQTLMLPVWSDLQVILFNGKKQSVKQCIQNASCEVGKKLERSKCRYVATYFYKKKYWMDQQKTWKRFTDRGKETWWKKQGER